MSGSRPDAVPDSYEFVHATRRVNVAPGAVERLAGLAEEVGVKRAAFVVDGFFAGGAGPFRAKIRAHRKGRTVNQLSSTSRT